MNCCSASRDGRQRPAEPVELPRLVRETQAAGSHHIPQVRLPSASFSMGDHFNEGYEADGETPVHEVRLDSFDVDATTVTVADFAQFIDATGYTTEAERFGSSAVFHLEVKALQTIPTGAQALPGMPWWIDVPGSSWNAPVGPGSEAHLDHPVVHVSWNDAQAYCRWAGRQLPTEAQWEYAARGGLSGRRYPWGDELLPDGEHRCNIYQGHFPVNNTIDDGYLSTAPVQTFQPNGHGLYQMAGNVWEWCADWFSPQYYAHSPAANPQGPSTGQNRVMRGGSYLCHDSYCNRYRVAARSQNTPDSSSSNCGFRTVAPAASH